FLGAAFGAGKPVLNPAYSASTQSVDFAVAVYKAGEDQDPANFDQQVDGEALAGKPTVFWYRATSHDKADSFFWHGGFFVGRNTPPGNHVPRSLPPGGTPTVDLTFAEVSAGGVTEFATDQLPQGAARPLRAAGLPFAPGSPPTFYDIRTSAAYRGPVRVCVHYG